MSHTVVQLTDLHLFSDPDERLRGVPTQASLAEVLEFAREVTAGQGLSPAHVLITGDLAHDELPETYGVLKEMLGDWFELCSAVPGNHDHRASIRSTFSNGETKREEALDRVTFSKSAGVWRLIGLDSHKPGEVAGRLGGDQLDWLRDELISHADAEIGIFLHHPPFSIRSAWLDRIGLEDAEAFMKVVRSSGRVRFVSAGHVHQESAEQLDNTMYLTTPSCAIQFTPAAEEFEFEAIPPGFRQFTFDAHHYRTEVVRLPALSFPPASD